jgi:hypothetical protein
MTNSAAALRPVIVFRFKNAVKAMTLQRKEELIAYLTVSSSGRGKSKVRHVKERSVMGLHIPLDSFRLREMQEDGYTLCCKNRVYRNNQFVPAGIKIYTTVMTDKKREKTDKRMKTAITMASYNAAT